MATRSRIGIENENGTVSSIYCHWDGYPEHNGKVLKEHYTDRSKVEQLIELGDISSLREEPGVTVAYHRDRGEDFQEARVDKNPERYFTSDIEEYGYLFTKNGEWVYVHYTDRSPKSL